MSRTYTVAERAEAVALAASIGPLKASRVLGYPPRTVASWLHKPAAVSIIAEAERDIAERLREAHAEALAVVQAGLRDPDARLSDKAAALRVLGDQLNLAEGRATANVALRTGQSEPQEDGLGDALTEQERAELQAYLDQTIAEYEGQGWLDDVGGPHGSLG